MTERSDSVQRDPIIFVRDEYNKSAIASRARLSKTPNSRLANFVARELPRTRNSFWFRGSFFCAKFRQDKYALHPQVAAAMAPDYSANPFQPNRCIETCR